MKYQVLHTNNGICFQNENGLVNSNDVLDLLAMGTAKIVKTVNTEKVKQYIDGIDYAYFHTVDYTVE